MRIQFVLPVCSFFARLLLSSFVTPQGKKKDQRLRNKQHNAELVKKLKADTTRKSFTGLDAANNEVNTTAVVERLCAADLIVDFADGDITRGVNAVNTCPLPCKFCGYLSGMGALVPLECACDWYANHGMSKQFPPKSRVVCGSCNTVRFDKGAQASIPEFARSIFFDHGRIQIGRWRGVHMGQTVAGLAPQIDGRLSCN